MSYSALARRPRVLTLLVWILEVAVVLVSCAGAWYYFSTRRALPAGSLAKSVENQSVSRGEVMSIARTYAEHRWEATAKNIRHGTDARGIEIQTPDSTGEKAEAGKWRIAQDNIGVPYKWGGFDTPQSFDAALKAGKAAGDVYSPAKRRQGDAAVSEEAAGVDCSGFISRCWKLPHKFGTAMLPGLCEALRSPDELQPGDIMDAPHGHVVLFVRWANPSKSKGVFYEAEAEPEPRVTASEHSMLWLRLCGARPYRYLGIRD